MIPPLAFTRLRTVLCLGAHSDDIEIGCGATLLRLIDQNPRLHIHWAVFSGNEKRQQEAAASASAFCNGAHLQLHLHNFRDSYFPSQLEQAKDVFEQLKATQPDLILTHYRDDAHQDHRVVNQLTWNTFRSHLVLEYEIPKFDGDLGNPTLFVPVAEGLAQRKCDLLLEHFPTQASKHWFDAETFLGLMRLRAMQCAAQSRYAEGFYARKLTL